MIKTYLQQRLASFRFAFSGLALLFSKTANARIHLVVFFLALILGLTFNINSIEWCFILSLSGLVLGLEAFNSALETTLNHLHPGRHHRVGQAKDLAAAAVLIAAIFALSVGVIIFTPYLFKGLN